MFTTRLTLEELDPKINPAGMRLIAGRADRVDPEIVRAIIENPRYRSALEDLNDQGITKSYLYWLYHLLDPESINQLFKFLNL